MGARDMSDWAEPGDRSLFQDLTNLPAGLRAHDAAHRIKQLSKAFVDLRTELTALRAVAEAANDYVNSEPTVAEPLRDVMASIRARKALREALAAWRKVRG